MWLEQNPYFHLAFNTSQYEFFDMLLVFGLVEVLRYFLCVYLEHMFL